MLLQSALEKIARFLFLFTPFAAAEYLFSHHYMCPRGTHGGS